MENHSILPKILLILYGLEFIILSINPYERGVWFAENGPIVAIVILLIILWRKNIRFSNTAYILMSVLIFLHTIGGHFTFERVPFDFITNLFGFERNMFDRFAHFSVGFYAYPFAELLVRKNLVRTNWLVFLTPIFFIVTVAAFYELFEWWFAVTFGGDAGIAFLGSQGDIWDAQKDILMDTLGALSALLIFWLKRGHTSLNKN